MTALRVPTPLTAAAALHSTVPGVWALTADARSMDVEQRNLVAEALRTPGIPGSLLLETCHRVEVYGIGEPDETDLAHAACGTRLLHGSDAIHHLLRVAAGLESAVVGEDQILAQLRRAADDLHADTADPVLMRLVQVALGLGRRVRRDRRPRERGLATRALTWLGPRIGRWGDARILVAGAGDMGTAVALAAERRGATVIVATRSARRLPRGSASVDLAEGARMATAVDGLIVALGGVWTELGTIEGPLPPIVDLSSPPAVPASVRELGVMINIDGLFDGAHRAQPAGTAFIERATAQVDAAETAFLRWAAARPSAAIARQLGELGRRRAEARAAATLRRLPDLTEREQAIVRRLADLIAADLLHEPLSKLGADATGTARAAARTLFDL